MNFLAFIIALAGALPVFACFTYASRCESPYQATLIKIASAAAGFAGVYGFANLLDLPPASVAKTGEYWLYIILVGAIYSQFFRRPKSNK